MNSITKPLMPCTTFHEAVTHLVLKHFQEGGSLSKPNSKQQASPKDREVSAEAAQDQAAYEDEMFFDPCVDPWGECYGHGGFVATCRCNREHPE